MKLAGPKGRLVVTGDREKPYYWCKDTKTLDRCKSVGSPAEAVVLTVDEAESHCGPLTIDQLHHKLQFFWGTITDYRIDGHKHHKYERVDREWHYRTWLQYFIDNNVQFGFIHAWVGALMRENSHTPPNLFQQFPEEFDISLSRLAIDDRAAYLKQDENGQQLIIHPKKSHNPRRVWDLCSHKVIPAVWLFSDRIPIDIWAVSHSWVRDTDRNYIWTAVNNFEWPVPIPNGVTLEGIREELIKFGCRYAWLDILCLRQEYPEHLLYQKHQPIEREKREQLRFTEWAIDVPTIGLVYRQAEYVVTYFNGLGRPFQARDWQDERHWLKRAWTLQETVSLSKVLVGGVNGDMESALESQINERMKLSKFLVEVDSFRTSGSITKLLQEIGHRYATNPVDKVAGLIFMLDYTPEELPVYKPNETQDEAWSRWMLSFSMVDGITHIISASISPSLVPKLEAG
ncbi:hypothetical protein BDZ91DRAFT_768872 [Kalaharituber pfeilii]|nr:hypothetical protein BDZ91DRAFT_768872 [Kalaharituber pfeilii]